MWAASLSPRRRAERFGAFSPHDESPEEVIRPQVPLRTPCYDLAPLADPGIDGPPKEPASTGAHSAGLTGSVCKEQGRIHRAIVTRDYWGFHLHAGEFQPAIRTEAGFRGLAPPLGVASHCPGQCRARVAREIRGILTYRRPLLPPAYAGSPPRVPVRSPEPSQLGARVSLVA